MRHRSRYAAVALAVGLLLPSLAIACLWDEDTLKMERSRFPETLELITGKFLRHSPEFYQWRIQNRLKRLESDPANMALLDDLAVAYDKTEQHDKAIETALRADKLQPDRYETLANLGTFYFHANRISESVLPIKRALRINPEAHFGREKYQLYLTEYVLRRHKGGVLILPLAEVAVRQEHSENPSPIDVTTKETFGMFLKSTGKPNLSGKPDLTRKDVAAAIKGILGMMRFAKYDSPVLLEALGTLLPLYVGYDLGDDDAKQLAARALLMASYQVPDKPAQTAYRRMATQALQMQKGRGVGEMLLAEVEEDFKKELQEGQTWYAELRERELSWIRQGKDPEAEFDKLYTSDPQVSGMEEVAQPLPRKEKPATNLFLFRDEKQAIGAIYVISGLLFLLTVAFLTRVALVIRHAMLRRRAVSSLQPNDGRHTHPTGEIPR